MKQEERAYYKAVEDHFALLRGTPFLISPKDFHLMKQWWEDGVPLAAVLAGMGEAFGRRRERGEDPVSSLAYCRHAVKSHAKRLAQAAVGGAVDGAVLDVPAALGGLSRSVRERAAALADDQPSHALLLDLARAIEGLPVASSPSALDETLASLEATALEALAMVLPKELKEKVEERVSTELTQLHLEGDTLARTRRALTLRAVREAAGLPRLELAFGSS